MSRVIQRLLLIGALVTLGGCGLFGSDEEKLEPARLIDIEQKLDVRRLWTASLGGDAENLRLALRPAGDGNRIYAAGRNGRVAAFDPATGQRLWQTDLDAALSAGPGAGEGLVVVAGADGDIFALEAATGTLRWRRSIDGESLAKPLITRDAVIVQTADNRLIALAAFDGRSRWEVLQSMPRLTMRGTSSPILLGTSVIAGFDNGRLLAVDLNTGDVRWDTLLALPSGRSDLERLADIDGAIAAVGQDIYAAGYQGRLAAVAAESGQMLWAVEISTFTGVSADWTNLYSALDNGTLLAVARRNGTERWRREVLLRREPTLPVPFDTAVAAGDFEGYVHFFSNIDGEYVARVRAGSAPITNAPLVVANRLYVQNDAGVLTAYALRTTEPAPNRAPDIADEGA